MDNNTNKKKQYNYFKRLPNSRNLISKDTNITPIVLTSKKNILLQTVGIIILTIFICILFYKIISIIIPNNTSNNTINTPSNDTVNKPSDYTSRTIITNSNLPASDDININNIYTSATITSGAHTNSSSNTNTETIITTSSSTSTSNTN